VKGSRWELALPAERGRRERVAAEVSAGGVVVRGGQVIVIVPKRRAADGRRVLALPKGHVDAGETALQAAIREVREETGVEVESVAELGEVRYWYTRDARRIAKSVVFYLFRYLAGDPGDHDEEIEDARWIPLEQARRSLSYAGEREMIAKAASLLAEQGEMSGHRKDR
jgi:8-oxo-dGTP pyrophosphatase MutT (NUDIX family)